MAPAGTRSGVKPRTKAKRVTQRARPKAAPKQKGGTSTSEVRDPRRGRALLERLASVLPEPRCELAYENAWQLLIATILSAQSTDARVNQATPALFRKYATPAALASAPLPDVEQLVHSTGFFRNKAKAIVAASKIIAERHQGEVPREMAALVELPGVARKTANLVLGTAYGIASGILVDTHVGRVARRLALTVEEDPVDVERDLCAIVPEAEWVATGHRLVLHGRYVCVAKQPHCAQCPLAELCPSVEKKPEGTVAERATAERTRISQGPRLVEKAAE